MMYDQIKGPREQQAGSALILIVDDEVTIAETLAEWLSDLGYTTQVAANGREALRLTKQRWPVLVLTDLMMPLMDGRELIAALRVEATARKLTMPPVILLTAVDGAVARAAGADAVVVKPFDLGYLERMVRRCLEQSRS